MITEHRVTHPEITVDGDDGSGIWYLKDRVIVNARGEGPVVYFHARPDRKRSVPLH